MTQKYDKEFKMNAAKLYLANTKSLGEIAADLGVSKAGLAHWVKEYKAQGDKSFPGSGYMIDNEIKLLQRELALVKQERDILKKAIAIFSEPPRRGINS